MPAGPQPSPQKASDARLVFLEGAPVTLTRIFTRDRIVLGRPKLTADLWLALFPLDDPSNQTSMDSMGKSHAVLLLEEQAKIRDDHSKGGTEVNGVSINGNWQALQDGDVIGFCHGTLRLRVRTVPGQWLRLDRLNNGPNVENYLFLQGKADIGGSDQAAIPMNADTAGHSAELRHEQGGFTIVSPSTRMTINSEAVPPGRAVGLRDNDLVIVGPISFKFQIAAYPG